MILYYVRPSSGGPAEPAITPSRLSTQSVSLQLVTPASVVIAFDPLQ